MKPWEMVDQKKCQSAFEDVSKNVRSLAEEGEETTEADWVAIRKDLTSAKGDYRLNAKEADSVMASLRKEFNAAPATVTTITSTSITTMASETVDDDWIAHPEIPGYASDRHIRLKCIAPGKGRQVGRIISLIRTWVNKARKGAKPVWRFRMFYQVTIDNKRVRIPYYEVAIARNKLEGKRNYGS